MSAPSAWRTLPVLGVPITVLTEDEALARLHQLIEQRPRRAHAIFYVNAHTLNTAVDNADYRSVLARADHVFGDGTGVRWAARVLHGVELPNVNGTDLTPRMFRDLAGKGYRYYMLGNTPERIGRAAAFARQRFPGWTQAGFHHGFLQPADDAPVVERINAAEPDMLLVGMGNPRQERWIIDNRERLSVPLCVGIGGLFDYWAGEIVRAPPVFRRLGYEWLHLLWQQPHKARRYLLGNPLFLARLMRARLMREGMHL